MLIGEYEHNIDAKGRVIIPARFREDLGEQFVITKGADSCLFIYALEEWERLEASIKALPMSKARSLQLYFFSGAALAESDKQGRVLIPQNLRRHANLSKQITVIGASNHAEIWDTDMWNERCAALTPASIITAMEEMGF